MNPEVQAYINELREQLLAMSDRAAGLAAENAKLKGRVTTLELALKEKDNAPDGN